MVKNPPANAGDTGEAGLITGLEIAPGGGNVNPLRYSCLGNSMGRVLWWTAAHGVAGSHTQMKQLTLSLSFSCQRIRLTQDHSTFANYGFLIFCEMRPYCPTSVVLAKICYLADTCLPKTLCVNELRVGGQCKEVRS